MKKHFKSKSFSPPQDEEGTIADLINKMQQQLNFLEKKIDTLIGQSPEKQHFDHSHHRSVSRQDNNYRERVLHRAICADCKKECEVPFKPSGERPVYCKDCFSKRKGGSSFNKRSDNRHREARHGEVSYVSRPHGDEKKKFFGKKRASVKRRKAHA
jgi:CxxC-x17-CxxC domain-containing protein